MHSNKLKRKLADIGVDASSQNVTHSFCLIGTPLPPLEKARDTGEFVPLWKQDVRDEKGRRRLHGAFTGGFSAGYFNTVGSEQGWTPSTFVSSRSERASKKQARPEDYMDEEDLAEIKDSQKLIDTTQESDLFSSKAQDDALAKLFPSSRDSIGSRLLRKMGWKPGQGIGPKISYIQLKQQERQLQSLSGWSAPVDGNEPDEEAAKHLYPPRDTPLILFQRKDNAFGIGYVPGARLDPSAPSGTSGSDPRISAGFGLGALNDADDDDIDVYEHASKEARHLAFDETETADDPHRTLASSRPRKPIQTPSRPPVGADHAETFSNGAPVLLGFALSQLSLTDDQWFEAPKPPDNWEPDPRRVWKTTSDEPVTQQLGPIDGSRQRQLTADQRGATLGETRLPSAPKSVFDYLSPKDRERLRNLASGGITTRPGPSTEDEPPPPQPSSTEESIPRTEASIAKSALHGFQPFQSDPGKAARYTAYLKSQATPDDFPESDLHPAPGQPREAFYHELREFANSATIFKPSGGVLGGRFATAKVVERLDSGKEGLYVPASGDDYMTEEERQAMNIAKEKEEKKEEDPKVNAAKMGMFGPLTRSIAEWDPAKLLCKRFGIREPVREIAVEQSASSMGNGPDEWKAQMPSQTQTFVSATADERGGGGGVGGQGENEAIMQAASASFRTGSSRAKGDLSNVGLGEDDDQGRDTLTYVKPERDIFKAIFESDDEDGDQDEDQDIGHLGSPGGVPGPAKTMATAVAVAVAPTPDGQVQDVSQKTTTDEPAYLSTGKPTTATYVPAAETTKGPVDMAMFRPTFNVQPKSRDTEAKKEKKEKKGKDKDRRKGKAILSFEDEGEGLTLPEKPKRRKSKKEKEKTKVKSMADGGENEEDMWVERPPAEAVGGLGGPDAMRVDVKHDPPGTESKQGGRRMRAVDFL